MKFDMNNPLWETDPKKAKEGLKSELTEDLRHLWNFYQDPDLIVPSVREIVVRVKIRRMCNLLGIKGDATTIKAILG